MTSLWVLKPKQGIGPVILGMSFDDMPSPLGFVEIPLPNKYETFDREFEEPSGNIRFSTEHGIVVSIEARKVCIYNGYNLIGMDTTTLEETIGYRASSVDEPVEYENGDIQTFRNYDDLDLYATVQNSIVIGVVCFGDWDRS